MGARGMKANAMSAVAEFRHLLEKKKVTKGLLPPLARKRRRTSIAPFEEGEVAADAAIEVFKKEIAKIK
jgi:hypothetical protein